MLNTSEGLTMQSSITFVGAIPMTQADLFIKKYEAIPLEERLCPAGDQALNPETLIDCLNELQLYYQLSNIADTAPSITFSDLSVITIEIIEDEDDDAEEEYKMEVYASK
jgi:hypothetical protein